MSVLQMKYLLLITYVNSDYVNVITHNMYYQFNSIFLKFFTIWLYDIQTVYN